MMQCASTAPPCQDDNAARLEVASTFFTTQADTVIGAARQTFKSQVKNSFDAIAKHLEAVGKDDYTSALDADANFVVLDALKTQCWSAKELGIDTFMLAANAASYDQSRVLEAQAVDTIKSGAVSLCGSAHDVIAHKTDVAQLVELLEAAEAAAGEDQYDDQMPAVLFEDRVIDALAAAIKKVIQKHVRTALQGYLKPSGNSKFAAFALQALEKNDGDEDKDLDSSELPELTWNDFDDLLQFTEIFFHVREFLDFDLGGDLAVAMPPLVAASLPHLQWCLQGLLEVRNDVKKSLDAGTAIADICQEALQSSAEKLSDRLKKTNDILIKIGGLCTDDHSHPTARQVAQVGARCMNMSKKVRETIIDDLAKSLYSSISQSVQRVSVLLREDAFSSSAAGLFGLLEQLTSEVRKASAAPMQELYKLTANRSTHNLYDEHKVIEKLVSTAESLCSFCEATGCDVPQNLADFVKVGKTSNDHAIIRVRKVVANLTCVQALSRGLKANESRAALVRKAHAGLEKKTGEGWVPHDALIAAMSAAIKRADGDGATNAPTPSASSDCG